tara:strand:+ start:451320 stop:451841 length:522 start_codon:yes stop_codon:yes gene_type:complete
MIMTLAAGAMSAKSSMDNAKYQEKVGENNALSAKYAAKDAMDRGAVAEDQKRNETRTLLARQNAALAANGIDSSTGTGLNILSDTAGLGEFDAQTIRSNAMKQAYGYNLQGDNALADGRASAAASRNNAYSTILSSGSKAYGMYGGRSPVTKASFGSGGMNGFGDSFSTSWGE